MPFQQYANAYGPWVIVTGASSGIGVSFARQAARAGLNVCLVARRRERLESLAAELSSGGTSTHVLQADLASDQGVADVVDFLDSHDVGLMINNAGYAGEMGRFIDQPWSMIDQMTRLNTLALVQLTHEAARRMTSRGHGGIINVASTAAFQPMPYGANYGGTKAYVVQLGEALSEELRGSGVHIVTVCPGPTDTEMADSTGFDRDRIDFLLMSADKVATLGLDALGNRSLVIPGLPNTLGAQLTSRLLPRAVTKRLFGAAMARTLK